MTPWYRKRLIQFPVYARTRPTGLTLLLYQVPTWAVIGLCVAGVVAMALHGC